MREVMYAAFDRLGFKVGGVSPAEELMKLDGFDGFVFAASRFNMSHPHNELWEITSLISDLEDLLGKDRSSALMIAAASRDQDLARLWKPSSSGNDPSLRKEPRTDSGPVPFIKI